MGQIHILSEDISNKIAAGEVVERPASVIKELVENSIDAKADAITVQIRDGGISYMRVTDNGIGMLKEDAELCFVRHATSKISSANDLDAIYTLGFRGEALASIAAVSKVDIYTKKQGEEDGVHVRAEGGNVFKGESFGTPYGTNIIVQDLFFNTPARMKFLKKNTTEAGYIAEIMSKFILSHPEISFKFINGAKEQYFSPGNNKIEDCIYTVYGKDYAKNIIKMDYTMDNIRVSGVIGKSNVSRPNRGYQSFFINGRFVKSPLIARAVEEAYKNQIMIGKFPMAVVNLEINPLFIDINVHPTKSEVKFSNENAVYNAVYFTVKNALYNTLHIPVVSNASNDDEDIFINTNENVLKTDNTSEKSEVKNIINDIKIENDNSDISPESGGDIVNQDNISAAKSAQDMIKAFMNVQSESAEKEDSAEKSENIEKYEKEEVFNENNTLNTNKSDIFADIPKAIEKNDSKEDDEVSILDEFFSNKKSYNTSLKLKQEAAVDLLSEDIAPDYKIIGQIFDTYIIIERNNEILFIDQHAAHERIKYEELKKSIENRSISSQVLLVPAIVSMTPSEYAVYNENKEFFDEMGFDADEFGENCIAIRSTPVVLEESELSSLMIELINYVGQSKKEIISERYNHMLYTIACKSAIKANHIMSTAEMKSLINSIFALDNINTCPHGRPIMIRMSQKQVEKEFKRIV